MDMGNAFTIHIYIYRPTPRLCPVFTQGVPGLLVFRWLDLFTGSTLRAPDVASADSSFSPSGQLCLSDSVSDQYYLQTTIKLF